MPTVLTPDVFSPVLLVSESLKVSQEQLSHIRAVLDVSCSDSAFAKKAYAAIEYVLVAGSVKPVTIASLNPNTAVLGTPSFDLHVMGSNFDRFSVINFAGHDEPTTFVSDKELTTGVNMDMWHGPDVVSVYVKSPSGVASDLVDFTFADAGSGVLSAKIPPTKPPVTPPVVPVGYNPPVNPLVPPSVVPHGSMEKK